MAHELLKHLRQSLPSVARKVEHGVAKDLKLIGRGAVKTGRASYIAGKKVYAELEKDKPYVERAIIATSLGALEGEEALLKFKLLKYDTKMAAGTNLTKEQQEIYDRTKLKLKKIEYLKKEAKTKKMTFDARIKVAEEMRAAKAQQKLGDTVAM
jgi:hypothetical protein